MTPIKRETKNVHLLKLTHFVRSSLLVTIVQKDCCSCILYIHNAFQDLIHQNGFIFIIGDGDIPCFKNLFSST